MRTLGIALLLGASAIAHDVITTKLTWSREVSRIFYRRCIDCHNDNGGAFSLTTYEATRPWAQAVKEEVLSRRMPPWSAIKGFGEFKHDAGLSQEEIEIISDWVEGGAPKGDEKLLPPLPDLPKGKDDSTPAARSIEVKGALTLTRPALISGIRPMKLEPGASLKVIAERPDGLLIPMIWINDYNPRFPRTYYFKTALALSKGTKIRLTPPGDNSVILYSTGELRQGS